MPGPRNEPLGLRKSMFLLDPWTPDNSHACIFSHAIMLPVPARQIVTGFVYTLFRFLGLFAQFRCGTCTLLQISSPQCSCDRVGEYEQQVGKWHHLKEKGGDTKSELLLAYVPR